MKEYPNGKMSKHIHSLEPGDTLEVKGPMEKLPYKANMKEEIGMVSACSTKVKGDMGTHCAHMHKVT